MSKFKLLKEVYLKSTIGQINNLSLAVQKIIYDDSKIDLIIILIKELDSPGIIRLGIDKCNLIFKDEPNKIYEERKKFVDENIRNFNLEFKQFLDLIFGNFKILDEILQKININVKSKKIDSLNEYLTYDEQELTVIVKPVISCEKEYVFSLKSIIKKNHHLKNGSYKHLKEVSESNFTFLKGIDIFFVQKRNIKTLLSYFTERTIIFNTYNKHIAHEIDTKKNDDPKFTFIFSIIFVLISIFNLLVSIFAPNLSLLSKITMTLMIYFIYLTFGVFLNKKRNKKFKLVIEQERRYFKSPNNQLPRVSVNIFKLIQARFKNDLNKLNFIVENINFINTDEDYENFMLDYITNYKKNKIKYQKQEKLPKISEKNTVINTKKRNQKKNTPEMKDPIINANSFNRNIDNEIRNYLISLNYDNLDELNALNDKFRKYFIQNHS